MTDEDIFKQIVNNYPNLTSYICFAKLVRERGFDRKKVSRLFTNLVDKHDYQPSQKEFLIDMLTKSSKLTKKRV